MRVVIEVSSSLKKFLSCEKELVLNDENITVEQILTICSIPSEEVGIVIINGKKTHKDTIVTDGDMIKLFPPIIAG